MKATMNFLKNGLIVLVLIAASCTKDSVDGPAGPTGPQGEQGLNGEQGVPGEKGDPGAAGIDGEALGVPGPQGDVGATGPQGPTGPKGDTGATGAQGLPGVNGQDGDDGQDGQDGQDGEDSNMSARSVVVNPLIFSEDTYFETAVSIANNEVVLGYIQSRLDTGQFYPGTWYAIPTPKFVGFHFVDYVITTSWDNDSFRFDMFETDGSLKFIPAGRSIDINALKLIIITVNPVAVAKTTPTEAVVSRLENSRVDINDYEAVSKYFGIDVN
ncbi:Collagen triple helix repeat-containing protein [Pricia antarctica]|uniref:Collagen triple helix repeat-containing protein n=1 Tax=Pricia antarctica TaxID=641691 RepID=A0A1G7B8Q0_9FLAO|nr:collagen-like protein [Pricia antarctica]SDE23469.1 Collagen triple helix repeat-containing protein [Pricia antarctica]